ncbi:MAG TPA: hypothetical protein VJC05_01150 [Candidatus Andersenbacteria bacterium]|nr:MAG: hypothetical protein A2854_02095 [Parcubacteria group bacterium RIFCSPHIGHO2_01_FULL_56_18]HLD25633.1 hypothetical protein [Candidatus Andersenbacteria bacterium]
MTSAAKSSLALLGGLVLLPTLNLLPIILAGQPHAATAAALTLVFLGVVATSARLRVPWLPAITHGWPLWLALSIQIIITLLVTFAYQALPDVDPYHWVKAYVHVFRSEPIDLSLHRILFHSLIHILEMITPFTPEQIFKFVLPQLSSTSLIPLWLIARDEKSRLAQLSILSLPLWSPSLLLSLTMGTPQAVLLIIVTTCVALLLHAYRTKDLRWHYLAGLVFALSSLYHGLALVLFGLWLAGTAIATRWRYPAALLLVLTAILSGSYVLQRIPQALGNVGLNLTFPASFVTIDGEPNGWPGPVETFKYYAFYAGLVFPLLALVAISTMRSRSASRLYSILRHPSTATLGLSLVFFLVLAEILPRFFNIVVLPERAWLLIVVFSVPAYLYLLRQGTFTHSLPLLTIALALVNLTGALYVNQLKQHALPDHAIHAARWMDQNIPVNATVYANHGPDYLDVYMQQTIRRLPADFFCQAQPQLPTTDQPAYLFYYPDDPRSPYYNRPWQDPAAPLCTAATIQAHPQRFPEIYRQDAAYVWEIK